MDQKKLWQMKWNNESKQLFPNNFARRAFNLIKQSNYKTLLDLGCGNGRDSLYFARKKLKITAVDWSKSGLDHLRKLVIIKKIGNLNIIEQDIPQLTFKPNSFDIIYAHLSLHYFNDKTTKKIFNRLYDMLKKNGLIFIKCKSTNDILCGRGQKLENNMYSFQSHVRHFFSKEYMMCLLARFQIIKIRKSSSIYHSYKSSFIEAIAKK